jgi:hypothetical protein
VKEYGMGNRRTLTIGVAAAVVAIGIGLAIWLWPGHNGRALPPVRARVYTSKRACLLTGTQGLTEPGAPAIWAGMEQASVANRIQVSYLAVSGQSTVSNAEPYVATLAQQGCDVIIATGAAEVAAVTADVSDFEAIRFAVVGGTTKPNGLTVLPNASPAATQSAVDMLVSGIK